MATDNSQFFPNRKALSQDFNYTPKPSSVNGRSFRVSIPTSNGQKFTAGQTMIFNIVCNKRNSFIDPQSSYIRYTVKSNNSATGNTVTASAFAPVIQAGSATAVQLPSAYGGGLFLDHNAYSPFNTSTLYSGSNMLEYINNCNILYSYILDTNFGYQNALSNSLNYGMYFAENSPLDIRKGSLLSNIAISTGTATASASGTALLQEQNTFCLPLLSGLLGMGSNGKLVPAYKIQDVLRLEILLETQANAFVQLGATSGSFSYEIINAELELQYVELDQEGMMLVESTTPMGSPTFIVGTSYRHYTQTIPSGSSGIFSCLVPSKLASLKNLIILPRPASVTSTSNAPTAYTLSSRVNPNWEYVVLKVSGTQIPQKPIYLQNSSTTGGYGEALVETFKTVGSLIGTDKSGLLFVNNYNVAATVDTNSGVFALRTALDSYKNAFAIAIDMELSNSRDVSIQGLNCLGESMYFEANISSTTSEQYTIDFFSCFDNLFIIDQTGYVSSRA
jgi:hypothetical protein